MGIKNTSSGPAYFKLDRELYDNAQTLKPAQRAKFIYACAQLFLKELNLRIFLSASKTSSQGLKAESKRSVR